MAKKFPLPKRFNVAMSEKAYGNLRKLNEEFGLGNNYLLTVLLENLPEVTKKRELNRAYKKMIAEYGAPAPGTKMKASSK